MSAMYEINARLPSFEETIALEALFLEKQELALERKRLIEATSELEKIKKNIRASFEKEKEEFSNEKKAFEKEKEEFSNEKKAFENEKDKRLREETECVRKDIYLRKHAERIQKETEKQLVEDDIKVSISGFGRSSHNITTYYGGMAFAYTFNISWTIPINDNFQFTERRDDVHIVGNMCEGKFNFGIYKYQYNPNHPNPWFGNTMYPSLNDNSNIFVQMLISDINYSSVFLQQHPQKDIPKLVAKKIQKELSDLFLKDPQVARFGEPLSKIPF